MSKESTDRLTKDWAPVVVKDEAEAHAVQLQNEQRLAALRATVTKKPQ